MGVMGVDAGGAHGPMTRGLGSRFDDIANHLRSTGQHVGGALEDPGYVKESL